MRVVMRMSMFLWLVGIIPAGMGCSTTRNDSPPSELLANRPIVKSQLKSSSPIESIQQASFAEPVSDKGAVTLTLEQLLAIARSNHPSLAAAAARVGEAQGKLTQAGLYPNPTVGYSGNQINDGPGTAGQQGAFISQELVTGGKLSIARDAARYGVTAADWAATAQWYETAAKVNAAYFELATAQAILRETEATVAMFTEALDRTKKLADAGKGDAYDVTRLGVERSHMENRVVVARQRIATAERMLAIAVGVPQLPLSVNVEFTELPTVMPLADAIQYAGQSSPILAAMADADQARAELRATEAKPTPNVQTMTNVAHDFTTKAPMVSVQVGVPLPIWDRNQGNIASARSRMAVTSANVELVRLRTIERLSVAYQRYENAHRQSERYRVTILPQAVISLEQIDKIYALRGERFADTLDARRTLAQARIEFANLQGEIRSAAAEIKSIVQNDLP